MKIRIAGILKEGLADGPGIRYVLFTQGCFHNCEGCHNPETHDPEGGYEMETDEIIKDIMKSRLIKGVTFSGGEPFLQSEGVSYIAERVKSFGLDVVTYTGYTFEELVKGDNPEMQQLLGLTDILIDGRFKIDERDISLRFRGSRNQRIIDVKKSLEANEAVLAEGMA